MAAELFPDVIELNVGGKYMTTLLGTLRKEPESMLSAMFSGRHVMSKDKDGRFFIDCNGEVFQFILDFLRFGLLPPAEMALRVYDLATYFGIQSLVDELESYNTVQYRKTIEEFRKTFDAPQYEMLKQEMVNMMYKCNASQQENKLFHLARSYRRLPTVQSFYRRCSKHISNDKHGDQNVQEQVSNHMDIVVSTSCKITEEMKSCLVYDLNKMGFRDCGLINFQDNVFQSKVECCRLCKECHLIMFRPNKCKADIY